MDSSAIFQKAIDIATTKVVIPSGKYYTRNTITISNKQRFILDASETDIRHMVSGYCFKFTQVNNCEVKFGRIMCHANNGGCLELYSSSDTTYVQYLNIEFMEFVSDNICVYAHADGGWVSETRFYNGRVMAFSNNTMGTGFKVSNDKHYALDHFSFINIGVECIHTGYHFIGAEEFLDQTGDVRHASVECINIINNRSLENFTTFVKTEGIVRYMCIRTSCLIYERYFDLSKKTKFSLLDCACIVDGGLPVSWNAVINDGIITPQTKGSGLALYDNSQDVIDLSVYDSMYSVRDMVVINKRPNKIKLTNQYGRVYGANEFTVKVIEKNPTGITLCDYEDNVICDFSNINNGDVVRFMWNEVDGWLAEKLNTIALTTL